MAEKSTENSTSNEQQQSDENITIPPISKPAAGAAAGAVLGSVGGPVGALVGGTIGEIASRWQGQSPSHIGAKGKGKWREIGRTFSTCHEKAALENRRRPHLPLLLRGEEATDRGYLGNQGGRSYAKRQVKVLLMFSVRLSPEN